jgi:type II restriction/modification system DNA methylase subunit YeeA
MAFADVWLQGKFGWEYKGKHKNLAAAYDQLLRYREALGNPPLLVVCDLDRFEIHTNFTGTMKKKHEFNLDGLAKPENILLLRRVFTEPDALRPDKTRAEITEDVAASFASLADRMAARKVPAPEAAHFLMKLVFCMFAEDIELLPTGIFEKTVHNARRDPARLSRLLKDLFNAMATGENFGADDIAWFNGGLFADSDTVDLTPEEIDYLLIVAHKDWSNVEPTIFGTLFERTLDPSKRTQIGAHYTSREDIETLLHPVMLEPLRREWEETKVRAAVLWTGVEEQARKQGVKKPTKNKPKDRKESKERKQFDTCIETFADRLSQVTVLDPACGSGNFLYVAIHLLLDLEKEVLTFASSYDLPRLPLVSPKQLRGIELNEYAQQLAQVVLWIGYLQWRYFNGYPPNLHPVLEKFESITRMDAILDSSDPADLKEPTWPDAEFIVGNPPFLGGKLLRTHLGDQYVDDMFKLWRERVKPEADLCCYWFEKTREMIAAGKTKRAGLLATQGIRGGANQKTLLRIKESGDVFFAVADHDWILNGASVHISMVGFDNGTDKTHTLDGHSVPHINADLTTGSDTTAAKILAENANISFMGDTKGGSFNLSQEKAEELLHSPNVSGEPTSTVIVPWRNGRDVTRRTQHKWIIDFGVDTEEKAPQCMRRRSSK